MMALYAAHNIARALGNFAGRNYASLRGIILNRRNIENERALVEAAAREIGTGIAGEIPRSPLVQEAEARGQTVMEAFPESELAGVYRSLARRVFAEEALEAAS
jgi:nitrogenase iron protein NifH